MEKLTSINKYNNNFKSNFLGGAGSSVGRALPSQGRGRGSKSRSVHSLCIVLLAVVVKLCIFV